MPAKCSQQDLQNQVADKSFNQTKDKGQVLWITGLSGSGKSTLASALHQQLPQALILDGDVLREVLGVAKTGFDMQSRKELAFTYARLCKMLADQGSLVIIATISLFHELHTWNRENLAGYIEIFLDVPEDIRRERDPKGLYAAQKQGQVSDMAGIEIVSEIPIAPHVIITHEMQIKDAVNAVLKLLHKGSIFKV